jgi:phosphate transport system substrate-binding protein
MYRIPMIALAAVLAAGVHGEAGAQARTQIRVVGSSTVFPFATTVAERFGRNTEFRTPVVEATGTGGGIRLLCSGVGTRHPDIANASRRM